MDINKYKSIVLTKETYELVKIMAEKNDRSISNTLKRLVHEFWNYESDYANLDCEMVSGGTPRIKRMIGDIKWLQDNSGDGLDKKYIIDKEEQKSLNDVLVLLSDLNCG